VDRRSIGGAAGGACGSNTWAVNFKGLGNAQGALGRCGRGSDAEGERGAGVGDISAPVGSNATVST
jgi:hypothetical protein